MIEYNDILSLNYYKYNQPFTGSCKGMRYRITHQEAQTDEAGTEISPESLLVVVWPEPFSYEETDRDLMSGDFVDVVITDAEAYDLIGELTDEDEPAE